MRQFIAIVAFACFAAVSLPVHAQTTAAAPNASGDSLYKKLGGYDAIAAVTDDFIQRLATDPKLKQFFIGVSSDHVARIRQLVVDLICQKTGGPCVYIGGDLGQVHKGLHITEDQWNAAVSDFGQTAKKFKIPAEQVSQLSALFTEVKPQIVNR